MIIQYSHSKNDEEVLIKTVSTKNVLAEIEEILDNNITRTNFYVYVNGEKVDLDDINWIYSYNNRIGEPCHIDIHHENHRTVIFYQNAECSKKTLLELMENF